MTGTPSTPRPGADAAVRTAIRVAAEYVRFKFTDDLVQLRRHLSRLPRSERRLAWLGLVLTATMVIATPVLAGLAARLDALTFEDSMGKPHAVSTAALALALAAFSVAWAYILTGAAQGPGLLWIAVGLLYVYLVVFVGLAIGRSYLHMPALLLPVAIGALTAEGRPWANMLVAAAVASIAVRLAPLPASLRVVWYWLWIPAAALLLGLHLTLRRRPWPNSGSRLGLAAGVTGLYMLAVALLPPARGQVAEGLNLSLNSAIGLLEVLWFLLGASFVAGAIAVGRFTFHLVDLIMPKPMPRWVAPTGVALIIVWVVRFPAAHPELPARLSLGLLGLLLAALGIRWRLRGITHEWLAGWFVAAIAGLIVLRTYATLDVPDLLSREAGGLAVVAFAYAITWEVAGRIRHIPLAAGGFGRPSPLLLYLGAILLVSAATLFGLAADLRFLQQTVIVYEYKGAVSLLAPMGLLALVRAWPAFPADARGRTVVAFIAGALLAVPAFLAQMVFPSGAGHGGALFGLTLLTVALVRRWRVIRGPLAGAAVGVAAALGLAVGLWQRIMVFPLHPLLTMIASLAGLNSLRKVAETIFVWAGTAGWRQTDLILYYVVGPLVAAGAGIAVAMRGASPDAAATGHGPAGSRGGPPAS